VVQIFPLPCGPVSRSRAEIDRLFHEKEDFQLKSSWCARFFCKDVFVIRHCFTREEEARAAPFALADVNLKENKACLSQSSKKRRNPGYVRIAQQSRRKVKRPLPVSPKARGPLRRLRGWDRHSHSVPTRSSVLCTAHGAWRTASTHTYNMSRSQRRINHLNCWTCSCG
jgi:hypothetical protein